MWFKEETVWEGFFFTFSPISPVHYSWILIFFKWSLFKGLISINVCKLLQCDWTEEDCWALVDVCARLSVPFCSLNSDLDVVCLTLFWLVDMFTGVHNPVSHVSSLPPSRGLSSPQPRPWSPVCLFTPPMSWLLSPSRWTTCLWAPQAQWVSACSFFMHVFVYISS